MRKALFTPVIALITLTVLVCTAGCGTGAATSAAPVRFADPGPGTATHATAPQKGKRSLVRFPTHPISFAEESRVGGAGESTPIGVTTLHGPKSGFTGKVWVWAPPEYYDKRNADKGFPVMEALPGSYGYPVNYWIGSDLKLEESLAQWSKNGTSLPFILVMPVLNPDDKQYYDGSDIPGQPKIVLARRLIARGGPEVCLAFQDGSKENTVLPKVRRFIAQYGHGPVKARLHIVPGGTHSAATYVQGLGEDTMRWVSARMQGPSA
ncbi:hypothetical protein AB0D04_31145 [Streptomyces sp. NPDC048483]|uniref:hypothetical protein n=1 Tax=Streptomyces sp. NPDC048483 TaxID=3154927 RepID=UPI0034207DC0